MEFLDYELVEKAHKSISEKDIEKILEKDFSGIIEQVPPSYSAIRLQGQRAYDMVRAGQKVVISKRKIEIFSSRIVSFSFPEVTIEMEVSVGTYIRSIARDLGEKLGLAGYVTMLHRSKIEHLGENLAKELNDISIENTLSCEVLFPEF